jgi:hypothetical protein
VAVNGRSKDKGEQALTGSLYNIDGGTAAY